MTAAATELPSVDAYRPAIESACQRIAPTWPLDQSIAVNPWWQMRGEPMAKVAARLQALGSVNCLMPKAYYKSHWRQSIGAEHLEVACAALGVQASTEDLLRYLDDELPSADHWHSMSELLDAQPERKKRMAWNDEVIQQISQFCGLYFQYPERVQQHNPGVNSNEEDLYGAWLAVIRQDKGIQVLMAEAGLSRQFKALPNNAETVFAAMFALTEEPEHFTEYAYALLLEIHGWASWLAYGEWQAALDGESRQLVEQLLAIRMAWDWVLWQHTAARHPDTFASVKPQFVRQFSQYDAVCAQYEHAYTYLWVWQRALEFSYQQPLQASLQQSLQQSLQEPQRPQLQPQLQAAFCIDVRSEPMRRALEQQSADIQTLGFAGFFGLPIEYGAADNGFSRPQLPGLLKPSIRAEQNTSAGRAENQTRALHRSVSGQLAVDSAPATFGLVEALGITKITQLVKSSWRPAEPLHSVNQLLNQDTWTLSQDDKTLNTDEQAELVAGILHAMGLTQNFAPAVLLLGHGSCSANNPQAAGLDCGACGGQTGEVNVKVLAQLLNDSAVRSALRTQGVSIPDNTRFIPGLHNTTTDEIICFEVEADAPWQTWLQAATQTAQQQRAANLGITAKDAKQLAGSYQQRSQDWAQLRPEWGLANNAAFIVAPRSRTQPINLQGRSFLHDYRWQDDQDFSVLELIITAPMIVTNWINLQYYASVTDNVKYGSGNKLLHNVVGGHIGVFEGNGGDLRIGLAMQSLHDGSHWQHNPLRLSVYIEAPRDAMTAIIDQHSMVAELLNNDWLYLFQLDGQSQEIWQYRQGQWQSVSV